MATGCGQVAFVDPDDALKQSLVITSAERIVIDGDPRTYFHVRVRNRGYTDQIRLSVEGNAERFELPLAGAHRQLCGTVETCLSLTLGPGIPLGLTRMILDAPEIGHQSLAVLLERQVRGYGASGVAQMRNTRVQVTIDDPIRRLYSAAERVRVLDGDEVLSEQLVQLFPRTFDAVVKPGACGAPVDPADPEWRMSVGVPFIAAARFSADDDAFACVSFRPTLPAGGAAVYGETIRGRALVTLFTHVYEPPVEISPLVFVPMFDLEMPNEARCNEARDLVSSSILEAATEIAADEGRGAETMMLDPVEIAVDQSGVPCRQLDARNFAARALGERIHAAIDARFGTTRRVRVMLVYATNLNLELPEQLLASFQILRGELASRTHRADMLLAIGPERPLAGLGPERSIAWIATTEPSFRETIKSLLATLWPFSTAVHTDQTVIPLVTLADAQRFERYRICSSTHDIEPMGSQLGGTSVLIPTDIGPAYRVHLTPEVLVDAISFVLPSVAVTWEGCEDLCDHAPPNGDEATTWEMGQGCQ